MFGKNFERYKPEEEEVDEAPAPQKGAKEDLTKFNAKKGKVAAKTVKAKYQWQILHSIGIPLEEIHRFENGMKRVDGSLIWDIDELFAEIKAGLKKAKTLDKVPHEYLRRWRSRKRP